MIVLLGMLAGAAFIPEVQTWYAQKRLDAQPGVRGTIGALSAGWQRVEATELHLETGDAIIDVPSLQATLPVKAAVWDGKIQLHSLVAKGWTIDLSRPQETPPAASSASAPAVAPAQVATTATAASRTAAEAAVRAVLQQLRGLVGGQALAYDLSLDGIDVEGDVIVAPPNQDAVKIHVVIQGGGLTAVQTGRFAVEAEALAPWPGLRQATLHGQLTLTPKSARRLDRLALTADIWLRGPVLPADIAATTVIEVARGKAEQTYAVDLNREGRHLIGLRMQQTDATRRLAGTWQVDLKSSDLPWQPADFVWPAGTAAGGGQFETDPAMARVRVNGRLEVASDLAGVSVPLLAGHGTVTLATQFSLERTDGVIRFDELQATLSGAGPMLVLHARGPFEFNEQTGGLKPADPAGEWLEGSLRDWPLAWLPALPGGLVLSGENVNADFAVLAAKGGFAVRPGTPLLVNGITLQRQGRVLARALAVSLPWQADIDAAGWRVQVASLVVSRAGRALATLEVKASRRTGADRATAVEGRGSVDLEALAAVPEWPAEMKCAARSANVEFTANLGDLSELDGKVTLTGHDPKHTLTTSVSWVQESAGKATFHIPVRMEFGPRVSDFSAEGTWSDPAAGGLSYVRLTGEKVDLDHLRLLAGPVAMLAGWRMPAGFATSAGRSARPRPEPDRTPFWGSGAGSVVFDFDQLQAGDKIYQRVGGSIEFAPGELRLAHGRGAVPQKPPLQFDGALAFEPKAESPYQLTASVDFGEVDAATLLPPAPVEEDALLEGRFSLTGTLTGRGTGLGELTGNTRMEFKLAGTRGMIRILKTDISDGLPQDSQPSAVGETVAGVGSLFGKLFGAKGGSGVRTVGRTAENVIDITNRVAGIFYDTLTITGERDATGEVRLTGVKVTAQEERLQGSGRIAAAAGQPYSAGPLSLDLTLGVRGQLTEIFAKAGLLAGTKDSDGFTNLTTPLRFGGTLEKIDRSMWHDLLVKAANAKPAAGDEAKEPKEPKEPEDQSRPSRRNSRGQGAGAGGSKD